MSRSILPEEDSPSLQQESLTSAFQRGRPGPKENLSLPGRSTRKIRPQLGGPVHRQEGTIWRSSDTDRNEWRCVSRAYQL